MSKELSKCCNSISKPYSTKNGGYMSCDCGKNEFGDTAEKCWCGELMSSDVHPIHEEVNEKVKLRSQESEGWEKEFDELCKEGFFDNRYTKTANYSRTKIYISNLVSQATEEAVRGERARIVEEIEKKVPGAWFPGGALNMKRRFMEEVLDIINNVHPKE